MQQTQAALGKPAGAVVIAVSAITGRGNKEGWLPEDLNNGRLDLFFLFLAGVSSCKMLHTACTLMHCVGAGTSRPTGC